MGQIAAKETVAKLKEEVPEFKDIIPELKDVTLKGVIPLKDILGQGAYGSVHKVKYGQVMCAAKKIHPILIENVRNEEKQIRESKMILYENVCAAVVFDIQTLFNLWVCIMI